MSSVCAAQPRRERSNPLRAVAWQRVGLDLSAQSGSFSRRSVRQTMFAGSALSALPRAASNAFSCSVNAADFLKKRNGFCTSQTRSEAEAALSGRTVVSETEASQIEACKVVVASRRMKSLPHLPPTHTITDFAAHGDRKLVARATKHSSNGRQKGASSG